MPTPDWETFSPSLTLSFSALAARDLEGLPEHFSAPRPTLAEAWSEVARDAVATGRAHSRWIGESTLVAAAPTRAALGAATEAAAARGASLRVPIHPADGADDGHWTMYRGWFEAAAEVDRGRVTAVAYCDPATAAREALRIAEPPPVYAYDDDRRTLTLSAYGRDVVVDVDMVAFMSLVNGVLPDLGIAAAVEEANVRLERLERLAGAVDDLGCRGIRFRGDTPVLRFDDRVVFDPVAGDFLESGRLADDHRERLSRASAESFTTPCTCREERRIRAALRPRAEIASFASDDAPRDVLASYVGDRHSLVYELSCGHASSRPTRAEWIDSGWSLERCEAEWRARPLESPFLFAAKSGWMTRAAVVWATEVGALAARSDLASRVARTTGYGTGLSLRVYVPNANIVFLTDEAPDDLGSLRTAFEGGGLMEVLELENLPLGPPVDYLGIVRIEPAQRFEGDVRRLSFPRTAPRAT